jgi:ADP-heptose:LPS heptosyltransferase
MGRQIRHILFIELLGGIGDVLIALPAIHALGRTYPNAKLMVLTFAPGGELLETDPLIGQVVYAPKDRPRQSVEQILAFNSFDLIVSDTNYDNIADTIKAHQQQSSSAPIVVTNLWRSPPPNQQVSDRFLQILGSEGVIAQEYIADNQAHLHLSTAERIAAQQALGAAYRPLIVLCPDAGMAIKRWPMANFIVLGKALQQQYGATILVVVGSEVESAVQLANAILADCPNHSVQLCQRSSLRQVAAVLAQADLMIAADTGLARIAAALDVPTITLFGPSWHERYGQPAPHVNLQGFAGCPERIIHNFTEQHCWYSGNCPFEWQTCLEDITPASVLAAANSLLAQRSNCLKQSATGCQDYRFAESSAWQAVRNLLVMRLDNIGDVIMTSPALYALRQALPTAKITLMASPSGALTAPLLPWIDAVLPWRVLWQDLGRLEFNPAREWELVNTLRNHEFDAVIIFTSFSQSPHPAAFVAALAGIPLRLGESKEQDDVLTHAVSPASDQTHQVDRNLRLIEAVGFPVHDRQLKLFIPDEARQTALQLLQLDADATQLPPYILLNPWTSCQSRNYDSNRFAQAAYELSYKTGWPIVVTGVEKDRQHVPALLADLDERAIDLVGATSLTELAALVANAKLVLTNNTSTMHIADATHTPSIILFAGTELESQWQPRYSASHLLRRSTVCNPCYQFKCPYQLQCLDISPGAVVSAALALLQGVDLEHISLS